MSETASDSTPNLLRVIETAVEEVIRRELFILVAREVGLDHGLPGEA